MSTCHSVWHGINANKIAKVWVHLISGLIYEIISIKIYIINFKFIIIDGSIMVAVNVLDQLARNMELTIVAV